MTTLYVDSRKRVDGDDASFSFEGAKLSVFKLRVADAFLSTDRGQYLDWRDAALGTLNTATLPVGAYTGARLAAWISSNESTNEVQVAWDGNRTVLNDQELRELFPNPADYPPGATPDRARSINQFLGPSFLEGASSRSSAS